VDYSSEEKTISYSCTGNTINKKHIEGCGYFGETKIENGNGKLAWKVEFAARWHAFDVRFEAFGKDIMDSVRINDWVSSEILGFHHPLHIKYEMFLDKAGKKISKSAGNVLTPQMWLKYGSPKSLLLLLYKRISGTRHISIEDVPNLMDEYDLYEDIYFDKVIEKNKNKATRIKGIYEYVNNLHPPNIPSIHIPYRILIQQSELFVDENINSIKKIYERLQKYGLIKEEDAETTDKINLSLNWARDFKEFYDVYDGNEENTTKMQLEDKQKKAIADVLVQLNLIANETGLSGTTLDPDNLNQKVQTVIYSMSKENDIPPKEFFKIFYMILINAERGPRLGNYIVDLGIKNVIHKIERNIK
jgi:lysyl-tRNA synthetase class 1